MIRHRLAALVLAFSFGPAVWADEQRLARDLARSLEPLAAQVDRLDDLWLGYRPSQRTLGVYRPGEAVLVRHCMDETPPGWQLLSDILRRPDPAPCIWFSRDVAALGESVFHIEHDFGVFRASLIREGQSLGMLLHEDFHGFQRSWPAWRPGSTLARLDDSADSAALRASLDREAALLLAALGESELARARLHLGRWLALRLHRDATQPEALVAVTRVNEVSEGTATWVGERGEMAILAQTNLRQRLTRHGPGLEPSATSLSNQMRATYYLHGGALTELLQRLSADDGWQEQVMNGATMPELVHDRLALSEQDLGQLLEEELNSREWRRAERAHARSFRQWQRQQSDAGTRFDWVLEFHVPLDDPETGVRGRQLIEFVSDSASQDEEGRLIVHHASQFSLMVGRTVIEVRNQPVILGAMQPDDDQTHALLAVPLTNPLQSSALPDNGEFVELKTFHDRRARISLRSGLPVLVRQVEVPP